MEGSVRGPDPSRVHHGRAAASTRRPVAAAGAQGAPGEPPPGPSRPRTSARAADRGVPRGGDPVGRIPQAPQGPRTKRRGSGGPGAAVAGASPPANGTRRGGRLHRGFLREGAQGTRRGDLRAKKEAGGTTHRPGDRHRGGGGDKVRDPHRPEQRACAFLSFAFRLSPLPSGAVVLQTPWAATASPNRPSRLRATTAQPIP